LLLDLAELKANCRAAGVARIEEIADRRYRMAFADGRVPDDAARRAVEAALHARVEDTSDGFTLDLSRRSWDEIRRLLAKALETAAGIEQERRVRAAARQIGAAVRRGPP